MDSASILPPQLIAHLNSKNIWYLYQARDCSRSGLFSDRWISSATLELNVEHASCWNTFCTELTCSGIHLNDTDDQFLWSGGDHSGHLTVKNAYATITNTLWHTNISGWRKQLWSWHLAPKLKIFTWLLIANKLNTWDILQRKGWVGPNIFQLCYNDAESVDHLFIKCPFSRQVWDRITLELNLKTNWDGSTLTTCFDYWSHREHKLMHLPSLVCWSIWLVRNKKIFENGTPSTSSATYKTLGLYKNWNDIHTSKPRMQNTKQTPDLEDIPTGWFDGATQSNGTQSGAGGLIRITKKSSYRWTFNCGLGTNTRAELLGAWAMLHLASRLNIEVLQILGDSRTIIEWLNNWGDLQAISLLAWKDKIRLLQPTFKKLSYKHIYREHNKTTDQLSKATLQKKAGIITYNLWIDGHEGPPYFLKLF
jgi:ribonuclease HI